MTEFLLKPAAEWIDASPEISGIAYRGNWPDTITRQAFFCTYADRDTAIAAAAACNLFPSVETYGPGYTTIFIAPQQFGGQANATLKTRHHGARTSGLYVAS